MKTRWERYCELRNADNWLLRNPRKGDLLAIVGALVVFAASQLLRVAVEWTARILDVPADVVIDFLWAATCFALFLVLLKNGEDETL